MVPVCAGVVTTIYLNKIDRRCYLLYTNVEKELMLCGLWFYAFHTNGGAVFGLSLVATVSYRWGYIHGDSMPPKGFIPLAVVKCK